MNEGPYRLFDYYRYEDRDLFFGRDEEVARLVGDILSARLLVLFAPSGSGKSSLLRAGVQPALEKRKFDAVFTRLGDDPIASIVTALETLDSTPSRGAPDLIAALAGRSRPVVVFIDQFEELFIQFEEESGKRKAFPGKLAEALFDPSLRVYFVLSLRSEYFVRLNEFREAIPTIFHNNANLELRPFDDESARAAIVGPSDRPGSGFTWEKDLPERIVRDLKAPAINPRANGVLPITLQIVCHTLWSRLPEGRGQITAKSYEAEGGAAAIITRRVFHTLEATPTRDRRLLCRLLRELITKDGTKRIQSLNRLHAALGEARNKRMDSLLARFNADLLVREESSRGQTWVELRHDYLAAQMKPWLDNEERRLEARRRRTSTLVACACAIVATLGAWLWNDYHTYTAEIGNELAEIDAEDELVVTRRSPFWGFRVETGFARTLLQDGGIRHNTFNVRDAPSDWTAIGEHLSKPVRDRLVLATRLDSSLRMDSHRERGLAVLPDFEALECKDIGFYLAADSQVLSFAYAALTTGNAKAKISAADALGRLGANLPANRADEVVAALLTALKDYDSGVKSSAADALGRLRANLSANQFDTFVAALLTALKDPDSRVKITAALTLGSFGANLSASQADAVVAALLTTLKDPNSDVKNSATSALSSFGANLPTSQADAVVAVLLTALKDPDSGVERFAAFALSSLGAKLPATQADAVAVALLTAIQDPDSRVKRSAASALGSFGANLAASRADMFFAALLTALKDPDSRVKRSAASALGSFGANLAASQADTVVAALLTALKDPDSEVKSSAAGALSSFGANVAASQANAVVAALLTALKDPDSDVKNSVAVALGSLGTNLAASQADTVVVALLTALKDPDSEVKSSAASALSSFGANLVASQADAVVAALLTTLTDPNSDVKNSATSALSSFGANIAASQADAFVAVLLTVLKEPASDVKSLAASALGSLGANLPASQADAVVAALLAALKDPDSDVKHSVISALGSLGAHLPSSQADAVVEALLDALKIDSNVRSSAASALSRLSSVVSKTQAKTALTRLSLHLAGGSVNRPFARDIFNAGQRCIRELTRGASVPTSEALIQHLESDVSRERTGAIHTLPRRPLTDAQLDKIRSLRDDSKRRPWVRMAALDTLMEIEREKYAVARDKEEAEEKDGKTRAPTNKEG